MLKYIFLGFIQGLTEFLPVSSSGHLVIFKHWLDVEGDNLILNIILHLGTLLAIVIFFRKDIKNFVKNIPLLKNIAVTTIVTAVMAVSGKKFFESIFNLPKVSAAGLVVTSIILFSTFRRMAGKRAITDFNIIDAILVGLFQGVAIIPGISRSGATISIQFWRGVERRAAFRYSFLAAIPAIIGAMVMEMPRLELLSDINLFVLIGGFLAAFLTGLVSLKLLLLVIQKTKFSFFGYYCLFIAFLALISG